VHVRESTMRKACTSSSAMIYRKIPAG
jgi:hypothetical protein